MLKLLLALLFCVSLQHTFGEREDPETDTNAVSTADPDTDTDTDAAAETDDADTDVDTNDADGADADTNATDTDTDIDADTENDTDSDLDGNGNEEEEEDEENEEELFVLSSTEDPDDGNDAESVSGEDTEDGSEDEEDEEDDEEDEEAESDSDSEDESDDDSDDDTDSEPASFEDPCDGLEGSACTEKYDEDGNPLCAQNAVNNDCYSIVQSQGVYGKGNFDDGYTAAHQSARSQQDSLNAIIAALGAVVAVLVLVVVGGAYALCIKHSKTAQQTHHPVATTLSTPNDIDQDHLPMITGSGAGAQEV